MSNVEIQLQYSTRVIIISSEQLQPGYVVLPVFNPSNSETILISGGTLPTHFGEGPSKIRLRVHTYTHNENNWSVYYNVKAEEISNSSCTMKRKFIFCDEI